MKRRVIIFLSVVCVFCAGVLYGQLDVSKLLDDPTTNIQYKARKFTYGTNAYEIWYYNGLKKLGYERFSVRFIYRWYPDGDITRPQREEEMVLHLGRDEAFWLMKQIAAHFESVPQAILDEHCPECLIRGRREAGE